jgi:thiamine-phosphate pyrophosphorylase
MTNWEDMEPEYTPAVERALAEAARWTRHGASTDLDLPELLLGLLAQPESRAAAMLAACQIDTPAVTRRWPDLERAERETPERRSRFSPAIQEAIAAAQYRLASLPHPLTIATEHLLLGMVSIEHEASAWLRESGLAADHLAAEICRLYGLASEPIGPVLDFEPEAPAPGETGILRVLDAQANRSLEGLRVVEDFVRFVLDDRHLTAQFKELRHALASALARIPPGDRHASRETFRDVGTEISTAGERLRADAAAVVAANLKRVEQSLRGLEEYGKVLDPELGIELEQLRYRVYSLERVLDITRSSLERLDPMRLYVLIDGRRTAEEFASLAASLVATGVHVLQLRDKSLADRELLDRARLLRGATQGTGTLFVMNDRPDLAVLARADGVHVGQEELAVKDAREIVGPRMLIGVSTHSIEQARQAVLDGANYIGVGPTFPSGTKQFDRFPGLALVRAVAEEIRLPAFAIGGIMGANVDEVIRAGLNRVAVGGAVLDAPDPAAAARELLEKLGSNG